MAWRLGTIACILAVSLADFAEAQRLRLAPPGQYDFVLDHAGLLGAPRDDISRTALACSSATWIPIVVVTIPQMADYGGAGMSIETFATTLFNQWGSGYSAEGRAAWGRGILLLVSQGDRKARIELGAAWDRSYDAICQGIMDNVIVPSFKQGDFAGGVRDGVSYLDRMARGTLTSPPAATGNSTRYAGTAGVPDAWRKPIGYAVLVFFFLLLIFGRSRGRSYGYDDWDECDFGHHHHHHHRSRSSSGSSGGGRSSGGGSSRGGGATGSW